MDRPILCCLKAPLREDNVSPFTKIVALDFYDGETGGFLQCGRCGSVFKFDMLDWDEEHSVRVFRLAALPTDAFSRLMEALSVAGTPNWPVWAPPCQRLAPVMAQHIDATIQSILRQAQPAEWVVAWKRYGGEVLAARRLPASELSAVPNWFAADTNDAPGDWFNFLGLTKSPCAA
jgi:hypothetical protein